MKLIDTHCHLDFEPLVSERGVLDRCREKLEVVIASGSVLKNNIATLEITKKNEGFVYCTLGCHPVHLNEIKDEEIDKIVEHIKKNKEKIVGIGEVGLDYFHIKEKDQRERQKEVFIKFIELARELKLPLVLHTRDAEKHAFNIIKEFDVEATFHCFNADLVHLDKIQKRFYISISTQAVYSKRVRDIVENVDLNRVLLETDSPFLGRGKTNYPWNVHKTLDVISELRGIDKTELANKLRGNTLRLFSRIKP